MSAAPAYCDTLQRLIGAVGEERARLVCKAYGGQRRKVPAGTVRASWLRDLLGDEGAQAVIDAFGAGEITIPMGPWSGPAARRRAVASGLNNDLSTAKAAALAGVHERTAWRVKARQKSAPGELPLFPDS